jgi:hypothetical protein
MDILELTVDRCHLFEASADAQQSCQQVSKKRKSSSAITMNKKNVKRSMATVQQSQQPQSSSAAVEQAIVMKEADAMCKDVAAAAPNKKNVKRSAVTVAVKQSQPQPLSAVGTGEQAVVMKEAESMCKDAVRLWFERQAKRRNCDFARRNVLNPKIDVITSMLDCEFVTWLAIRKLISDAAGQQSVTVRKIAESIAVAIDALHHF